MATIQKRTTSLKQNKKWRLAQWLEIRWWKRYLHQRDLAAYRQQKYVYWQKLLSSLAIAPAKNDSVLDAGCGPAGVFLYLTPQKVDAVDPLLDQYIEHGLLSTNLFPNVNFSAKPIEQYTPQRTYDWVFCLNAINHVADWELAMDKLTKLCAPLGKGTLVLGIDVHRHAWIKTIFRLAPGDLLHPHQHDRSDYRKALHERGWQIENTLTWKKGNIFDYWLVVARIPT